MAADTTTDAFVRSSPLEVATGWIYGLLPATKLPDTALSPRQALDDAIRPALVNGPCYVTFSGGRDSSAVLAAATALARREGHALPIPVTRVYPDLPDTDESEWQRLVIGHLGLTDWLRLELTAGETDLLGPAARAAVRDRGAAWPPALHTHGAMFKHLSPGSLMTGEGGDAVLGLRRGTALTVLRRRRRPTRELLTMAATAVLPAPLRKAAIIRGTRSGLQNRWLQPAAFAEHTQRTASEEVAEPLRYDAGTWHLTRRRFFATAAHNQKVAAAEFGLRHSDPLLDHGFIAALARSGKGWGYNGRTATMRALFADALPLPLIARSTKARFNHAHSGSASRDFARDWDGTGVDPELVDIDRLRQVWLSDEPTMATGMLLHTAWLAAGAPEL
jgi:asparagine synthase (glutamine-hydrolysing)